VFYDLDTPITLSRLGRDDGPGYIGPGGLAGFDLVLSYTGGAALDQLRTRLGATRVAPLYGHVDPDVHRPAERAVGLRPTCPISAPMRRTGRRRWSGCSWSRQGTCPRAAS
jgi:hypothetical protein